MKRGVVMSIHKKHVIVMTANGQFLQAPLSGQPQLGEEIVFEQEYSGGSRFNRVPRHLLSVAALIMVIGVSVLLLAMRSENPVVAYVSMDINPSIEFGVDSEGDVRELRGLNSAGESIIEGITYNGEPLEKVAMLVIDKASLAHYLDDPKRDIVITSILLDDSITVPIDYGEFLAGQINQSLVGQMTSLAAEAAVAHVTVLPVPTEIRNEAAEKGISSGKLAIYLMAKEEGFEVELEQFKEQSIDQITEPIGGVRAIVANAEDTSKQKLKELLEKEQAAQKVKEQESAVPSVPTTAKPTAKPTAEPAKKPTTKPGPTEKPDKAAPTTKPDRGKNNGKDESKESGKSKERSEKDGTDGNVGIGGKAGDSIGVNDKKDRDLGNSRHKENDEQKDKGKGRAGNQNDKASAAGPGRASGDDDIRGKASNNHNGKDTDKNGGKRDGQSHTSKRGNSNAIESKNSRNNDRNGRD